jgi:hypothetical protein
MICRRIRKLTPFVLLGLTVFVIPVMPSIVLCGLSLVYFKRYDWAKGFFKDKWGTLGVVSFLARIMIFVVGVYISSRQ